MKKFTKIIICILLVAAISVTAVACMKKDDNGLYVLKTPKLYISSGNVIEWKEIKYATNYKLTITDDSGAVEEVEVKDAIYTLGIDKKVTVKARAIGDGVKYTNSEFSNELVFDPPIALKSPDGVAFQLNADNSITVTWHAVASASGYTLSMTLNNKPTDAGGKTSATEMTIPADKFSEAGAYIFTVKATGDGDKVLDSKPSKSVTYTLSKKLADPTKVLITTSQNTGTIKFNKVEYADRYLVRAMIDDKEHQIVENVTIGSDEVSIDISKFTFGVAGKYTFEVKATRKAGMSAFFLDSSWVKVNLKTDETKLCEMTLYSAPAELQKGKKEVDDKTEDILKWKGVEGAPKYTIEIKSASNSYTDIVDNTDINKDGDFFTYNLTKSTNLTGDGAENRAGGKVVYMNVYVPENLTEGILKGISTTENTDSYKNVAYQSYKEPNKEGEVYLVENLMHLAYIAQNLDAKYKLTKEINASGSYFYGFSGDFGGEFDGNGKVLRNLYLVPSEKAKDVSLFGNMKEGAVVKDLIIVDSKIDLVNLTYLADKKVNAAFIANTNSGTIDNVNITSTVSSSSSSTPSISTEGCFGGIAFTNSGTISNSATSFIASAHGVIGGITALNMGGTLFNVRTYGSILKAQAIKPRESTPSVSKKAADDPLTPLAIAGGIAGLNSGGTITYSAMQENATVTAIANGNDYKAISGGLVGIMYGGSISNCYVSRDSNNGGANAVISRSTSSTDSDTSSIAGGFIGFLENGTITKSYNHFVGPQATGTVGGFVGKMGEGSAISEGYTLTSSKISANTKGGVVGINGGKFTNFYYGKYETSKDGIINPAPGYPDVEGIKNIDKGDDMQKLNLDGFMLNDRVIGYMVLKDMPYFDRGNYFRSTVSKNDERMTIAKGYYGAIVLDRPQIEVKSDIVGYGIDRYEFTMADGKKIIINRVIQIS